MGTYDIRILKSEEYEKCRNIWDIDKQPGMAKRFYKELVSGIRITFIYLEGDEFIGEGSLVFTTVDPDYTVPNQRIYLSRMMVKETHRNLGIGSRILDHLIAHADKLGYAEISLGVDMDNMNARHLYEKKGFTEVLFIGEDVYGEYMKLLKRLR